MAASRAVVAQTPAPDFQQMTSEERTAYLARMRTASEHDRRAMMDLLGLKKPDALPPAAADPVYRLLGAKGLGTTTMPAPDVSLTSGELAFRNHDGDYTDAPDSPAFLEMAQRDFDAPVGGARR